MSVSGAGGATSGGTPSTRRHSPPGTLPSTRGVRSGGVDIANLGMLRNLKSLILQKAQCRHRTRRHHSI